MNDVHDAERLKELQTLPLERKIQITQTRIIEWYQHYNGNVFVSFSGGKDSTVLMNIARKIYPNIPACFSNTGLEFPEIQRFVKTFDNVDIVTPEISFAKVVEIYGYPLISKDVAECIQYSRKIGKQYNNHHLRDSLNGKITYQPKHKLIDTSSAKYKRTELMGEIKRTGTEEKSAFNKDKWLPLARELPVMISGYCCNKMKKAPTHKYQTQNKYKPILATMAEESRIRKQAWIRVGCNAFEGSRQRSTPMAFWTEQDVLRYIVKNNLKIASVYGDIVSVGDDGNAYPPTDLMGNELPCLKCTGYKRTGCIFCAFGLHLEKGKTRWQLLAETHPRQYEFCIGGGQWVDNPAYDPTAPEYDGEWKNWNPKKIWTRSSKGLGMGKVFDMCNEIYGKDFYRYE